MAILGCALRIFLDARFAKRWLRSCNQTLGFGTLLKDPEVTLRFLVLWSEDILP